MEWEEKNKQTNKVIEKEWEVRGGNVKIECKVREKKMLQQSKLQAML